MRRVQWMSDVNSWKNKCAVVRGVQSNRAYDVCFPNDYKPNKFGFWMSRKILKANENAISHVHVGDCKILTDIVLTTFNSDSVFWLLWFQRDTRRFLRHDIYDEPSVDWLATIGVPHSQAAPVTKFTGYLTRSKKIQWNFQRSSGKRAVFFIVFTVLLLLLLLFYFLPYACFAAFVFFFSKILFFIRVHASETADYTPSLPSPLVLDSSWVHNFFRLF